MRKLEIPTHGLQNSWVEHCSRHLEWGFVVQVERSHTCTEVLRPENRVRAGTASAIWYIFKGTHLHAHLVVLAFVSAIESGKSDQE